MKQTVLVLVKNEFQSFDAAILILFCTLKS